MSRTTDQSGPTRPNWEFFAKSDRELRRCIALVRRLVLAQSRAPAHYRPGLRRHLAPMETVNALVKLDALESALDAIPCATHPAQVSFDEWFPEFDSATAFQSLVILWADFLAFGLDLTLPHSVEGALIVELFKTFQEEVRKPVLPPKVPVVNCGSCGGRMSAEWLPNHHSGEDHEFLAQSCEHCAAKKMTRGLDRQLKKRRQKLRVIDGAGESTPMIGPSDSYLRAVK